MPIYEYKCSACQHELESLQKFSDAPLVTCPACGKDALTKLLSAAGFQLKGSGWYQTDFKSSGAKPAAKTDATKGEGGKESGVADGAKSADAKPADGKPSEGNSSDTKTTAPVVPSTASSSTAGSTPAAGA